MTTAIVYGPAGCGKTVHAKQIAKALGIPERNTRDLEVGRPITKGFVNFTQHRPDTGQYMNCIIRSYASFGFPDLRKNRGAKAQPA